MTSVLSVDPRTHAPVEQVGVETTAAEVAAIGAAAAEAFTALRDAGRTRRASLLRAVADALTADGEGIVATADRETALGAARLSGELTRTCLQLRLFADVLDEGSYLEATLDAPGQTPMGARPDLRRMLVPLGPVAVFGASNFPLAFSVPGGDTASALAAGCPVVIKAHPSHPATCRRAFTASRAAAAACGLPPEIVNLVYGLDAGVALVGHPDIRAVGFTGSQRGGRALADLAAARPDPIPFFGELGSINPVVVTPAAAAARPWDIASGFVESMTLGVGQFCTKPGLLFVPAGPSGEQLRAALIERIAAAEPGVMLSEAIGAAFEAGVTALAAQPGVRIVAPARSGPGGRRGVPVLLEVAATDLAPPLLTECFGPAALLIEYTGEHDLARALSSLPGQLTATIHGEDCNELARRLHELLVHRAGRLIWNGFPTGVAVTWAMQHGGPWPAATVAGHTSVGPAAIRRWLRPVTYQNAPQWMLPDELRDGNPAGIPRRMDGKLIVPAGRADAADRASSRE